MALVDMEWYQLDFSAYEKNKQIIWTNTSLLLKKNQY